MTCTDCIYRSGTSGCVILGIDPTRNDDCQHKRTLLDQLHEELERATDDDRIMSLAELIRYQRRIANETKKPMP